MPPAVAPGAQVRARGCGRRGAAWSAPRVMRSCASDARTTISLANSMPDGAQPERQHPVPAEGPHAAVEVADRDVEEQPAEHGQHRVAEVAVQRAASRPARCRPRNRLPITRSAPPRSALDEAAEVVEGVAVVGVGHEHVTRRAAASMPPMQRGAVAAPRDVARPARPRLARCPASRRSSRCRRSRTSPAMPSVAQGRARLADADREGLCLVEAGQDDGQLDDSRSRPARVRGPGSAERVVDALVLAICGAAERRAGDRCGGARGGGRRLARGSVRRRLSHSGSTRRESSLSRTSWPSGPSPVDRPGRSRRATG